MKRFLDAYYRVLTVLLTLLMGLMVVPVLMQIVSRYTQAVPRYIWTEEAARFCFVWIIMIGSMIAVRDRTHFDVDILPHPKTPRQTAIAGLISHVGMMLMAIAFAWYGIGFARFGAIQTSEMSGINMLSIYISFPLAGFTWVIFLVEKMVIDLRLLSESKSEPPE